MNVTTIITINNNNNIQLLPRNNPYIEEKKLKNYFIPSAFKHIISRVIILNSNRIFFKYIRDEEVDYITLSLPTSTNQSV